MTTNDKSGKASGKQKMDGLVLRPKINNNISIQGSKARAADNLNAADGEMKDVTTTRTNNSYAVADNDEATDTAGQCNQPAM